MKRLIPYAIISFLCLSSCTNEDFLLSEESKSCDYENVATPIEKSITSSNYTLDNIVTIISLTTTEKSTVNKILNDLQTDPIGKGYTSVFNKIATKKISKISRDGTRNVPAYYVPSTNAIVLSKTTTINQYSLQEEFIHAAQDRTYSGGINQYASTTGTPNIEFEAKMIQDLINTVSEVPFGYMGIGPTHDDDYIRWIIQLTEDGNLNLKFPSLTDVMNVKEKKSSYGYYDFMTCFKAKAESYNFAVIKSLKPLFLDYVSKNCNF